MSVPLPEKNKTSVKKALGGARWIVLAGLVVLVGLGVALTKDFYRKAKINQEINTLEEEIGHLSQRNEELTGLISYFESDTFKEREARSKLNVQKPGERVIEVEEPEIEAAVLATQPVTETEEPRNNIERWWLHFFDRK